MTKIPVLACIRYGYEFTFGHLGTIIGLIWLPMVIVAVPGYFVASHYYAALPAAVTEGNSAAVGQLMLLVLMWSLSALFISSMMYVAVMRQALGLRQGPAIVHFSLGPDELRIFGAVVGLIGVAMLFLVADGVAVAVTRRLGGKIAAELVAVGVLLAILYALFRLGFFLAAATVAEEKVGLGRAWQLSAGNFWRIAGVALATLGPLLLIMFAAQVAILGPHFYMHKPLGTKGDEAENIREMIEQMRIASENLPALSGLSFVLAPLFLGLGLAPSAFAYRALTAAAAAKSPDVERR